MVKPFDNNGILFHIGTRNNKSGKLIKYRNPHNSELITVVASSLFSGNGSSLGRFVQHKHTQKAGVRNCTDDKVNSYFRIDFGPTRKVEPNAYCLRADKNGNYATMRNWRLEGSNNLSAGWTLIKKHENDKTMKLKSMSVGSWLVDGGSESFRHLRIFQHGKNAGGFDQLLCAGFEVYGRLFTSSTI